MPCKNNIGTKNPTVSEEKCIFHDGASPKDFLVTFQHLKKLLLHLSLLVLNLNQPWRQACHEVSIPSSAPLRGSGLLPQGCCKSVHVGTSPSGITALWHSGRLEFSLRTPRRVTQLGSAWCRVNLSSDIAAHEGANYPAWLTLYELSFEPGLPLDNGNLRNRKSAGVHVIGGSNILVPISSSASSWARPTRCGWCLTDFPYTMADLNCSTILRWMALHYDKVSNRSPGTIQGLRNSINLRNLRLCTSMTVARRVPSSRAFCPWAWCTRGPDSASPTWPPSTRRRSTRARS